MSGHDASSPSPPSPSTDNGDGREQAARIALLVVIAHSVLLVTAAAAESEAGVRAGWGAAIALLVIFIVGPTGAMALHRKGHRRAGGILLLGFMPAAAFIHMQTLFPVLSGAGPTAEASLYYTLYVLLIAVLLATSLVGSVLALMLMRSARLHGVPTGSESHP